MLCCHDLKRTKNILVFFLADPSDYPEAASGGPLPDRVPPVLTQETLGMRSVYRKKNGGVRLVCEALGSPEPQVGQTPFQEKSFKPSSLSEQSLAQGG